MFLKKLQRIDKALIVGLSHSAKKEGYGEIGQIGLMVFFYLICKFEFNKEIDSA